MFVVLLKGRSENGEIKLGCPYARSASAAGEHAMRWLREKELTHLWEIAEIREAYENVVELKHVPKAKGHA